jgi:hypothetical protein
VKKEQKTPVAIGSRVAFRKYEAADVLGMSIEALEEYVMPSVKCEDRRHGWS